MTADYQREKDGHPDADLCRGCGSILEPDDTGWPCVICEDMHYPGHSDDALTRREYDQREAAE